MAIPEIYSEKLRRIHNTAGKSLRRVILNAKKKWINSAVFSVNVELVKNGVAEEKASSELKPLLEDGQTVIRAAENRVQVFETEPVAMATMCRSLLSDGRHDRARSKGSKKNAGKRTKYYNGVSIPRYSSQPPQHNTVYVA